MKKLNDVFVDRIKKYMKEQNLTQYRLAYNSGVPFATVKSIMQKRTKNITLKTIILFASGLNITPSKLIEGDEFLEENLDI